MDDLLRFRCESRQKRFWWKRCEVRSLPDCDSATCMCSWRMVMADEHSNWRIGSVFSRLRTLYGKSLLAAAAAVALIIWYGVAKWGGDVVHQLLSVIAPPKQVIEKVIKPSTPLEPRPTSPPKSTGSIKPAKPQPTAETKCLREQNAALIENRHSLDEAKAALAKCKSDFRTARIISTEESAIVTAIHGRSIW